MGKKGKIAAVVIAAAVLCGAVFAKVEYDKWHAAQPLAVAHAAVAELAERVPEAEIDAFRETVRQEELRFQEEFAAVMESIPGN